MKTILRHLSLVLLCFIPCFIVTPHDAFATNRAIFRFHAEQVPLQTCLQALAKSMALELIQEEPLLMPITAHVEEGDPEQFLQTLAKEYQLHVTIKKPILHVVTKQHYWQKQEGMQKIERMQAEQAPLALSIVPLQYANAELLAKQLQTSGLASTRGRLQSDARTNAIVIHDTEKHATVMKQVIRSLDRPVSQLMIEAKLISIDHDAEQALGLNMQTTPTDPAQTLMQHALRVARLTPALEVKLSMLEKSGHAEVLSSPRLFTLDQQTAEIETGEEVPYQENSESGNTTVAFKKAVLGLKITPHVLPRGRIALTIQLTHDRPSTRLIQGMPMITTRHLLTNVILRHEEMVVLGGIYEHNDETTVTQWAGLHRIPVLGALFRHHEKRHHKRELLILVRPTLMANTT